jgi:SAM-dependent methyltransferase
MTQTNAFGRRVPSNPEILEDPATRAYVRRTLDTVVGALGLREEDSEEVLALAESCPDRELFESQAHAYLARRGALERVPGLLSGRAAQEYVQVAPHARGTRVLDYGCGDGRVGELFAQAGNDVRLADIYEHPHVKETGLPFALLAPGGGSALEGSYDTTLQLAMLHHCEDPMRALTHAAAHTAPGGRLLVIESVYGVREGALGELTHAQQWGAAFFFDRLYNRVLTDPALGVHTPGNYLTPEDWTDAFEGHGLRQLVREDIGIDIAIVPEYHVLYALEKPPA